ncbi:MAG TPA: hypothetical protein PLL26_04615 [Candidatus Dojkabacteria bacterium]|nr:hypothetical protein [Candidatus Dojkabacteria bacterium]
MSIFADAYSRYLSNYFHYINKLKTFEKYFKNSIVLLTDPNFMPKSLIDCQSDFPKYPYFFNAFIRTDSINLVKIYNSTMDNTDNLLETVVGSEGLGKKKLYDLIPSSLEFLLAELNFQFSYISTLSDLYNQDLVIKSFVFDNAYRNFFSDLYAPLFHSVDQVDGETAGLENKSFTYQYMLYCILYNGVSVSHNIYSNLLLYLNYMNSHGVPSDRVNQATVLADFQDFVTRYADNMSIDLTNVIGKSIYDFQKISQSMIQNLISVISAKITDAGSGFYKSFYDFYSPFESLNPATILSNNVTQQLNALISADIVSEIYADDNIIDQNVTSSQTLIEDDICSSFMEKMSQSNLRNYLFLCFLYKFWPLKFLNILQLSMKEYVESVIKTTNDDICEDRDYKSQFKYFVNFSINYSNLKSFLDAKLMPVAHIITYGAGTHAKFTFTPGTTFIICANSDSYNAVNNHDFIYADGDMREHAAHVVSKVPPLTLIIDDEYRGSISAPNVDAYKYTFSPPNYIFNTSYSHHVPEFACFLYYIYILDQYFNSTQYDLFIKELTADVFTYLRDNGHIDYSFDWYEYHDIVDVYLKVYMRWKLLDQSQRCVLPNYVSGRFRFKNGSPYVYCSSIEEYNAISNGDYIFSENDTIDKALVVDSHHIYGSNYVLQLTAEYNGTSTEAGTYDIAYTFKATDMPLFYQLTNNFVNKLYPRVITNSTDDPIYDVNVTVMEESQLRSYFDSFTDSSSFVKNMHQFNENLILSTLTRETIYSILSNFV